MSSQERLAGEAPPYPSIDPRNAKLQQALRLAEQAVEFVSADFKQAAYQVLLQNLIGGMPKADLWNNPEEIWAYRSWVALHQMDVMRELDDMYRSTKKGIESE